MKRRRQESILAAAETLFRDKGYERTSIEEISELAEVSVGTLYTYFGSKGGVMHKLIQPVIDAMKRDGQAVIDAPPAKAVDAFAALYKAYKFSNDWKSLNLLKAFGARLPERDKQLETIIHEFESFIRKQLAALTRKLIALGKLNADLRVDDVSYILQVLLFAHFEAYVGSGGRFTYEHELVNLHRRLRVIFQQWPSA
jgi:AcrR family transcriptional regulator